MADYENSIFNNLPRRRAGAGEPDDERPSWREVLSMRNFDEGPLPPRPHYSGKGGPSINQTPPPPVLSPVNSVAPVASGTTTVGSTLSCTTGTWTNSPTGYAYQWLRNGSTISGATSSTYLTVTADGGTSIRCTVTATNAHGSGAATSNALSMAPVLNAPANTVAPVVSGTAAVGSTLSCTTGTWTNSPTSYAYQWLRGGVNISGATSATYLLVAADGGTSVSCRVTATNAVGNTSIASNALAILGIPANTAAPVASGTLTVGSTLSCTTGTWTNSPTYTYQWQRGGANISGATSSTYVTVSADGGTSVGCLVTATNASGSASQASNTLAIAAGGASVWSASDAAANAMTLSNGGLTVAATVNTWQSVRGTVSKTAGKLYVEFLCSGAATQPTTVFGIADASFIATNYLSTSNYSSGISNGGGVTLVSSGFTAIANTGIYQPVLNDVIQIAVDLTSGKLWYGINNVWAASGNPASGTNPVIGIVAPALGLPIYPAMTIEDTTSGVWTLQPTAASQKYAAPSGFTPWDGAGAHSAQATAYLARTVGGNEGGNGANIATLIDGLVADGVWAKLDALYVLAQQNVTDSLLNLVSTNYTLTNTSGGSLTFASYKGYNGFNANNNYYLDTGFNPTTATSPNFIQNNGSFGVWSYAVINESDAQIGNGNGSPGSSNIFDNAAANFYGRLNGASGLNETTTATKGLFAAERTAVATMALYQNGATSGPHASDTSGVSNNNNFVIGNAGPGGVTFATTQLLSAAFIGASLGASLQLALYNRLRTYMTSIGVP